MNLDVVWHYEDEIDQWAAEREFEMRSKRYTAAKEGFIGAIKKATEKLEEMRVVMAGFDERYR